MNFDERVQTGWTGHPRALTPEHTQLLLVEDSSSDAAITRKMLSNDDRVVWQVQHVESLASASSIDSAFDMAVVDLGLPDSDGLATIDSLTSVFPETPMIVVTGGLEAELADRALSMGVQDCLDKDAMSASELARALHFALARGRRSAQLQALLASSREGILVVAADGRVLYSNRAAREMFDGEIDTRDGVGFQLDTAHPSQRIIQVTRGNVRKSFAVHSTEIRWNGEAAMAVFVHCHSYNAANDLHVESRRNVVEQWAHELNVPATRALGHLHELHQQLMLSVEQEGARGQHSELALGTDRSTIISTLRACQAEVENLASTVNGARRASPRQPAHRDPAVVDDSVARFVSTSRAELPIRIEIQANEPAKPVSCDGSRLDRVLRLCLHELLREADLGQLESMGLRVFVDNRPKHVRLELKLDSSPSSRVHDQDIPRSTQVPAGDLAGFRLIRDTLTEEFGSIVVLFFGGKLRGAEICLWRTPEQEVSLQDSGGPRLAQLADRRAGSGSSLRSAAVSRPRVLLVDDDVEILRIYSRLLREHYEVVTASDARSALDLLSDGESFVAIVCDMMMPDMTGYELYLAISAQSAESANRVIFVSGGIFSAELRRAIAELPNTFLHKPFKLPTLLAAIEIARSTSDPALESIS